MHRILFVMSTFVLLVSAASCGSGSALGTDGTPEEVIQGFYAAANDGDYELTKQYASAEALVNVEGPLGALAGGWESIVDGYTRNGTIDEVNVGEVAVRGDRASTTIVKHFTNGDSQELQIEFIREDNAWKIDWSTLTL